MEQLTQLTLKSWGLCVSLAADAGPEMVDLKLLHT